MSFSYLVLAYSAAKHYFCFWPSWCRKF